MNRWRSWCRPANPSSISDSMPTRLPQLRGSLGDTVAASSNAVLPMPTSPRITSTPLIPLLTDVEEVHDRSLFLVATDRAPRAPVPSWSPSPDGPRRSRNAAALGHCATFGDGWQSALHTPHRCATRASGSACATTRLGDSTVGARDGRSAGASRTQPELLAHRGVDHGIRHHPETAPRSSTRTGATVQPSSSATAGR